MNLLESVLIWMVQHPFATYLILCFALFLLLLSMLPKEFFTAYRHEHKDRF